MHNRSVLLVARLGTGLVELRSPSLLTSGVQLRIQLTRNKTRFFGCQYLSRGAKAYIITRAIAYLRRRHKSGARNGQKQPKTALTHPPVLPTYLLISAHCMGFSTPSLSIGQHRAVQT